MTQSLSVHTVELPQSSDDDMHSQLDAHDHQSVTTNSGSITNTNLASTNRVYDHQKH